jgi:hypothetical protein
MPLTIPAIPSWVIHSIDRALLTISPQGAFAQLLRGDIHAVVPHAIYAIGSDALTSGRLDKAVQTGWRVMLMRRGVAVAAAEAWIDGRDQASTAQLNVGPHIEATMHGIIRAEKLAIRKEDFELRLLRVPEVATFVLWLHSKTAGDQLLSIGPVPNKVAAAFSQPTVKQILRALGAIAKGQRRKRPRRP